MLGCYQSGEVQRLQVQLEQAFMRLVKERAFGALDNEEGQSELVKHIAELEKRIEE